MRQFIKSQEAATQGTYRRSGRVMKLAKVNLMLNVVCSISLGALRGNRRWRIRIWRAKVETRVVVFGNICSVKQHCVDHDIFNSIACI